ncbi:cysteine desulfurase family protein [Leadbetterella byssophila]|uniref:cysteine desulfurase n=1 Tax=Leadbetterella byssophila (strain DSM 17132 / JCM 16389 / KACC 11308 / NBRC 106382 / 4M15) TaxID=649349 RepID=E4RRZ6_LEAB4|nr:cysteine desulfurase family protein [Leadbetterella byssophila]ADQ18528.1 Cysteine desulfurase [Leadbetterella byssophila DSM 17132]
MTKKIYLDNAATTPIDPAVLEVMMPYLTDFFGNPSSIHSHGRKVKSAIENARKTVASLLNTSPGEIFFTSGGTEADNTAISQSVATLGIKHIVSSRLEHHAVLHTLEHLEHAGKIKVTFLENDSQGVLDIDSLPAILENEPNSMISLMHGNNEIANLLDLHKVGEIAREYNALFHSDTVQTMGHYAFDLQTLPVDFIVGAAHKFHGPKGVGFLYINANHRISPFIHGGAQERNMRGGTENLYGIIGLAKALELANAELQEHQRHVKGIKALMIQELKDKIPGVQFNGRSADVENSLYTVLNVSFPEHPDNEMLLFNLDIEGISCSGGSACSSGTNQGSHVLNALNVDGGRANVRFSFSRFTTEEEIRQAIQILQRIFTA